MNRRKSLIPSSLQLLAPLFEEEDNWIPKLGFRRDQGLTLAETDSEVTVEAAMPGLAPEDIEVTFQKGVLWLRGRKSAKEEDSEKKHYYQMMSEFEYHVRVPSEVDMHQEPEAIIENGVVKVRFQKAAKEQPKRITVRSN